MVLAVTSVSWETAETVLTYMAYALSSWTIRLGENLQPADK